MCLYIVRPTTPIVRHRCHKQVRLDVDSNLRYMHKSQYMAVSLVAVCEQFHKIGILLNILAP